MVVDTSALIAVALGEPTRPVLLRHIESALTRLLSAVSFLETGMILRARLGERSLPVLNHLLDELGLEIVAFDAEQSRRAVAAFGRFGKGMGHRAQLNFGDCAVYALAELRGQPVLATGNDFASTDLTVLEL